jgi:peptidoglycan/LPS O-acetylase OafA/YrhL
MSRALRVTMAARNLREKFTFLDGLRGVAAVSVGILHAGQIFNVNIIPGHGYLAVDFFFCLSGFVIAYAYEARLLSQYSWSRFALLRIIRLYPMVVVGIALGTIATLLNPSAGARPYLADVVPFSLLFVPIGLIHHLEAYPINNPLWSIFFELCANFAYAALVIFRKISLRADVALLTGLVFMWIVAATSHGGIELIGYDSWLSFSMGFVRVALPFHLGVMIWRYRLHAKLPVVHWVLPLFMILVVLWAPDLPSKVALELVAIGMVMPTIIALGANVSTSEARRFLEILGGLSYPFYVIHQPILKLFAATIPKENGRGVNGIDMILIFAVILAASWMIYRVFDEPFRRFLTRAFKRHWDEKTATASV